MVQPLFHPCVGDKVAVVVTVKTSALAPAAGARDDVDNVLRAHAGDLLLPVTGRNEMNARMQHPQNLQHCSPGVTLTYPTALARERRFVYQQARDVTVGRICRLNLGKRCRRRGRCRDGQGQQEQDGQAYATREAVSIWARDRGLCFHRFRSAPLIVLSFNSVKQSSGLSMVRDQRAWRRFAGCGYLRLVTLDLMGYF